LQSAALSAELRQAMKRAGLDIGELRMEAAEAVGVEPPELVKLRRVTWWSLIQAVLFSQATVNLDLSAPSEDSDNLIWILLGLLAATVLAFALVARLRRAVLGRVRKWWPEVRNALGALRGSNKLFLLFG
jgi:hypothetical protein